MEARLKVRRDLALLAVFTLLLHIPFLSTPVQGDEVTYLDIASHVLRHPLTPLNFQYAFMGKMVEAAGNPHPTATYIPAVPWILLGHFSVVGFHAFYLLFALAISFAAYALAARFTAQPLWAALLVASSPLVQVNTNTLASPESPALAFLLIGAAAFFARRFWIGGIALALAGLTELQALALPPILLLEYVYKRERPSRGACLALAAPYFGAGAWQALQFLLTHRLPGAVLLAYGGSSAFSRLAGKAASALALTEHLGVLVVLAPLARRRLWVLVPGLLAAMLVPGYPWWQRALLVACVAMGLNALLWLWDSRRAHPLLANWCLLYFAFAAVVFFAGASRYLLPLVAPMVLLFVMQVSRRGVMLALAFNLILGLNLSLAADEFARAYTEVQPPPTRPFLVNGDWGFRYYLLQRGGTPLYEYSVPAISGEWIVASELSLGGYYDSLAEEAAVPLRALDLRVRSPLRLIDRYAHSGFSASSAGLLPFSFSTQPLDRITYSRTSAYLYAPGAWTPTEFSGRLVYVPQAGAPIRIPFDAEGTLHFALFARGQGAVTFRIARQSGESLFEQRVAVDGELWQPRTLPQAGVDEAVLQIDYPAGVQAGWGELVSDSTGPSAISGAMPPDSAYLNLGDLRTKAQLRDGWYGIEDGGWRWMSKRAGAELPAPSGASDFDVQLFFPPDHMQRAGGPVTFSVLLNGRPLARQTYEQPGGYEMKQAVPREMLQGSTTHITLEVDRAVAPGASDQRELGAVVSRFGFLPGK